MPDSQIEVYSTMKSFQPGCMHMINSPGTLNPSKRCDHSQGSRMLRVGARLSLLHPSTTLRPSPESAMPPKSAPKRLASSLDDVENMNPEQPVKKARKPSTKSKKKDVGNCSLTKKEIGDKVKYALRLEKYSISKMHFEMQMDMQFFRSFFMDSENLTKPLSPMPAEFDDATPIVVVEMNRTQAGELLGVSKVTGGNRMATTLLGRLCVIFRPKEGKTTVYISPEEHFGW
ncbi:hypothetical protein HII31_03539 [Pseudocercospora fuligena]|uniref:Uncharacterized protein n=1 Tax=Pseudocercospora fuligena TaxID=685502 RepID=A0A8H6RQ39_9PEZI|nr:hypothetical protein HII31_03539 [Pseudocercospora fuligena]